MKVMPGRAGGLWAVVAAVCLMLVSGSAWADEGADGADGGDNGEEAQEAEEERAVPAGPTPRLFLLPVDSLRGELSSLVVERVNESTRRRVDTERNSELLPSMTQILGATDAGGEAALVLAEEQYTSGIGLLNAGQYDRAAEAFQRAVDLIEANLEGLRNFGILTDALSNLAAAYFHSGYDLDARQYMQRFAQLVPDATLDPEIYPEELREIYDDEVDRVTRAETGILHISTPRPGAIVTIDGVMRGETPLTVDDVGFGHHYLVVVQGEDVHREVIRVRARGQEEEIEVTFEAEEDVEAEVPAFFSSLQESLRTGRFGEGVAPHLAELVAFTDADYVAWVLMVRDGPRYIAAPFVYRARDGMLVQGENVDFNMDLSNLRSRVDRLSLIITGAVGRMPEDRAVVEVDLDPEVVEEPVVVAEPEEQPVEEDPDAVARAEDEPREALPVPDPTRTEPTRPLPDDPPGERSNTMRYLGWGGAAALAGGLVAGTVIMIVRSGSSEPGFEAEVEW